MVNSALTNVVMREELVLGASVGLSVGCLFGAEVIGNGEGFFVGSSRDTCTFQERCVINFEQNHDT